MKRRTGTKEQYILFIICKVHMKRTRKKKQTCGTRVIVGQPSIYLVASRTRAKLSKHTPFYCIPIHLSLSWLEVGLSFPPAFSILYCDTSNLLNKL